MNFFLLFFSVSEGICKEKFISQNNAKSMSFMRMMINWTQSVGKKAASMEGTFQLFLPSNLLSLLENSNLWLFVSAFFNVVHGALTQEPEL